MGARSGKAADLGKLAKAFTPGRVFPFTRRTAEVEGALRALDPKSIKWSFFFDHTTDVHPGHEKWVLQAQVEMFGSMYEANEFITDLALFIEDPTKYRSALSDMPVAQFLLTALARRKVFGENVDWLPVAAEAK